MSRWFKEQLAKLMGATAPEEPAVPPSPPALSHTPRRPLFALRWSPPDPNAPPN